MGQAMFKYVLLASGIAFAAMPQPAFAWGDKGHETVALIAAQEIKSPTVKAKIAQLLEVDDAASGMEDVATWADKTKTKQTAPWHFTDIEITSSGYDAGRDCPNEACSIAQIDRHIAILKDA